MSYGLLSQLFLFENLYLQNVEMASDSIQSNKEGKTNNQFLLRVSYGH